MVLQELGLAPLVIDLGCPVAPAVPHVRLPGEAGAGPARCLSGGDALAPRRLEALLALGRRWGARLPPERPLLLAECVPGGTSTALAVLTGLGVDGAGLVSGSLRHPDHGLKAALVTRGLRAAGLAGATPLAAASPPAPAAAGRVACRPGGSHAAPGRCPGAGRRRQPAAPCCWPGAARWPRCWPWPLRWPHRRCARPLRPARLWAPPPGWPTRPAATWPCCCAASAPAGGWSRWPSWRSLRFSGPCHPALAAYEEGYVKEGVGAGGLALLWQLSGRSSDALARRCDRACRHLLGPPPPTVR